MFSDYGTDEARKQAERKVKGCMVIQNRGVTKGGNVVTTGIANAAPDTIGMMFMAGQLQAKGERQADALRRRDNGRALQTLYAVFRTHGKEIAAALATYRVMNTPEGHVGSALDLAETLYNDTLRLFTTHESKIIQAVCIDDNMVVTSYGLVRRLLDDLPRKMEQAENSLRDRIKNTE